MSNTPVGGGPVGGYREPAQPRATNILGACVERALSRLESALGDPTITWVGSDYPCVPSTIRRGTELQIGGRVATVELTVAIRKAILPLPITADSTVVYSDSISTTTDNSGSRPSPGRRVSHRGRTMRVLQVREPAPYTHWELDLGSVNK